MAKNQRKPQGGPTEGFWNKPALMNMTAELLIVLGSAALAWAAVTAIQRLPVFPLREMVVVGKIGQVTRGQIEHVARAAVTGNFFTIDLDSARAAFGKLPWVRKAEVRRRWPDGIELALEEHVAAARWRPGEGAGASEGRLVNTRGEIFAGTSDEALPVLSGPEGSAPRLLERHRDFDAMLAAIGRRVEGVALTAREAWQLRLEGGLILELGRDQPKHPLAERIARFVLHYPAAREAAGISAGVVDMRYPNGFALRPDSKS
ncbi:MAG: cell division protein FtsQ/DivIB [Rhodocyclaceae bacterium]|nr:cell division protein FtsQ/DivIB [Rhodocyclaceae bacterium]